ncbi:Sec-independent protein translocase subunit TatA [Kitasatospora kazusensis]|uniref:Sec-independent protein translocase protein TatA n=1 Tax=Kitasatospora kazusensis TaxID=407974 RepID=A0ABP5LI88_9ACTN
MRSPTAILVLVVFAVVLFGAKRLPDLARALGRSARILKSEAKSLRSEYDEAARPTAEAPKAVKAAPGDPGTAARPVREPDAGQNK